MVDPSLFSPLYDAQFCEALAEVGHEVTLIGRALRADEELRGSRFRTLPFCYRVSERALKRFGGKALAIKGFEHILDMNRLIGLVKRERPDVVHVEWILLPLLDRWFFRRLQRLVPVVLTVHNATAFHGGGSSRLMRTSPEHVFAHVDHFIPHTESTESYLRSFDIAPSRWTQIQHPAIYLPEPGPEPTPPTVVDGEPKTILLFGALKPYKGIDTLVEAALELMQRRDDCRVVIAGKPFMDFAGLKARVEEAGRSAWFDFDLRLLPDADLARTIQASDIVVFPYREIDASGALACACQFGKPIIASKIGTFEEAPAGDHLYHIPPGEKDALEQALEVLVDDDGARREWGEKSLRLKSLIPSWRALAETCTGIYRNLVDARDTTSRR